MSSNDKSMKQAMKKFHERERLRRVEMAKCTCQELNLHVQHLGIVYSLNTCPAHGPCFSGDATKIGKR